jgi:asparagine synthase (glutamine-hydrolysing)
MANTPGNWEYVSDLLLHAGQPFGDTSLFAVNSVCRLMRNYVTVALSGDGGDEAFGGYDVYWRLARVANWQRLPRVLTRRIRLAAAPLCSLGMIPIHLPDRMEDLSAGDDTATVQGLFCLMSEQEHKKLCGDPHLLPVRRLFDRQWEHNLPAKSSRLERLSALATEINIRLVLPNDFLFKVDAASMKESLEIRVPMLDEDLIDFGLSLPHRLKVSGRTCKQVLRSVAARQLPDSVATKPKWGFSIPMHIWVNSTLKDCVRENLLDRSSRLSDCFDPRIYTPMIHAFCKGDPYGTISTQNLYPRIIMLMAVHLALSRRKRKRIRASA